MKKKRIPSIVDTNVTVVANRKTGEPLDCVAACAQALNEIMENGLLVIDKGGLIFDEYRRYLSFAGQPGAGDIFFKWLSDNRYRPERVSQVALITDPIHQEEFVAFPADPSLVAFDHSDRKFVAAALTHPGRPPIFIATDSDWWMFKDELSNHGVLIQFVCGESRFIED